MVGSFLAIREQERKIIREAFVDPLVAVAGPTDDIAPPLMSDFVKGNEIVEMFLAAFGEAGALLSFGRKKGISGNIEQAGPALAERTRDLGDIKVVNGEWPRIGFVKRIEESMSRASFLRASAGLGSGICMCIRSVDREVPGCGKSSGKSSSTGWRRRLSKACSSIRLA